MSVKLPNLNVWRLSGPRLASSCCPASALPAGDKVMMLADGNGSFAKSLGVELDLGDKGLGVRSRR